MLPEDPEGNQPRKNTLSSIITNNIRRSTIDTVLASAVTSHSQSEDSTKQNTEPAVRKNPWEEGKWARVKSALGEKKLKKGIPGQMQQLALDGRGLSCEYSYIIRIIWVILICDFSHFRPSRP